MPETDGSLLMILTGTCVVLLVVILALMIRISSRVGRLEILLGQGSPVSKAGGEKSVEAEPQRAVRSNSSSARIRRDANFPSRSNSAPIENGGKRVG